jgi:hypothetical protein
MKKTLLFVTLMTGFICTGYSQLNTNYGTGTVSIGFINSSFGYNAGNDLTAAASGNAFFGAYSGTPR